MYRVKTVIPSPGYSLYVEFEDGLRGSVSLVARLFGPMFEPLLDEKLFSQVTVDEYGAICWPNGADLAPDALYRNIKATTPQEESVTS